MLNTPQQEPLAPDQTLGFLTLLQQLNGGGTLTELKEKCAEVVKAVHSTGKKGDLVFKLTFAPATKGGSNALVIRDEVKMKLPEPERNADFLYANADGSLQRQDPKQLTLNQQGMRIVTDPSESVQAKRVVNG